jgi:hypothetical protein
LPVVLIALMPQYSVATHPSITHVSHRNRVSNALGRLTLRAFSID